MTPGKKSATRRTKKQIMMDMLTDLQKMVEENCEKPVGVAPTPTAKPKTPRTKKATQVAANVVANVAPMATAMATNKKCKGVATYNDFLKKYVQDHADEYKSATGEDLTYAIARNGAGTQAYRQMCGLPPKPSKRTLGIPFTRKANTAVPANTAVAATAKPTRRTKKAVPASNMIFNTLAAAKPKATRKTKKKVQIKNTPINLVAEAEAETLDELAAEGRTFAPTTPPYAPMTPPNNMGTRTFAPVSPAGTPPGASNLYTNLGVNNMGMQKVRLRNGSVYAMTNEGSGRRGLYSTDGGDNIEWVGYLENNGAIRRTNAPNEA